MRHTHNKRSKALFIKFRNRIRESVKYNKFDFKNSKDKVLNQIADMFSVQIITWSPQTREALVCIYDKKKYPTNFSIRNTHYPVDYNMKWLYFGRDGLSWEYFELFNNFIFALRDRYFPKQP